jgi:ElaB/YqjD/DUF883 family membrane-anchored ribosome-binding protein
MNPTEANPTEAKFRSDLDAIAAELDLGVQEGKYSWADVRREVRRRTGVALHETDVFVQEHPWQLLALFGAAGVALGWLMTRR